MAAMSTFTKAKPAATTAFSKFIDYAGLFPPAKLAMKPSLEEYDAASAASYAWMLGRFIVPASRLAELSAACASLPGGGAPLAVSVIVDASTDARAWLSGMQRIFEDIAKHGSLGRGIRIEVLEIPLPALATQRETYDATIGQCAMLAEKAGLRDRPIYVEIPRDRRWSELLPGAMTALARYRLGAKVRCGGITPEAFPSPQEVAEFIAGAVEYGVPFKATAGLHHPIRHRDESTGFTMHGFMNVLAATALAADSSPAMLADILGEERAAAFALEDRAMAFDGRRIELDEIARARTAFVAYGSCSFAEPVADLTALAMLPG